jgi:LPXTG-site transpeptidase (sortase) family protein
MSEKLKQRRRDKVLLLVLVAVAAGLLVIGLKDLNERRIATTKDSPAPIAGQIVTNDVVTPDETKPKESYDVPADQPRRIVLGSIGAEGYIQQVSTNDKNTISVPTNVHFAGWYTGSVKPGKSGLSIIDGHVSGVYSDGIFKNLAEIKAGDQFSVEYGDLTTKKFEVVDTIILPETESAALLFEKQEGIDKQLNLITCGGKFNKGTQTYDDRVVIVSKAID